MSHLSSVKQIRERWRKARRTSAEINHRAIFAEGYEWAKELVNLADEVRKYLREYEQSHHHKRGRLGG